MLQQYLPLAVLKLSKPLHFSELFESIVATVLTACGIETPLSLLVLLRYCRVVATVLTACGIETLTNEIKRSVHARLQQYLPLAVLKRLIREELQQLLRRCNSTYRLRY